MSNGFNFKFDGSAVNQELFSNGSGSKYPIIVWHGKYTGNPASAGFWTLDADSAESAPGPHWVATEFQFGGKPDSPLSPVWKTDRLRVCVLGVRKRFVIETESGERLSYRWGTPKTERVNGTFKAHFQVAVTLPLAGDQLFSISLQGVAKSKSWSNSPSGKWHDPQFPTGAEFVLAEYARMASREVGATVPPLCSFWMDLIPFRDDKDKPRFVNVGHGTHVLPFTADFTLSPDLDSRFVGMANFLRFQELRKNELIAWESEWDKAGEPVKGGNGRSEEEEIRPLRDEDLALVTGSF